MTDKGGGLGGWIARQVKENMGQTDTLENIRKAVQQEEANTVKPDYDFKFANKFEQKLSEADVDAAKAAAGRKKKKLVKQTQDGHGRSGHPIFRSVA